MEPTVLGGDGMPVQFPQQWTTVIASSDARGVRRSTNGGTGAYSELGVPGHLQQMTEQPLWHHWVLANQMEIICM
ncbi:MAG: hypothetical protein IPN39_05255 [Chitinophagaceae bacterium]|nr:hypothetical protein [Chitinophagaceae bacterium]